MKETNRNQISMGMFYSQLPPNKIEEIQRYVENNYVYFLATALSNLGAGASSETECFHLYKESINKAVLEYVSRFHSISFPSNKL